jgi:two-component system response regulator AtoC
MLNEGKNLRILLVEDDIELLQVLAEVFSAICPNVHRAQNGEEALRIMEKFSIDFIISDIQMPVMDGLELLKKVRQLNPDLPVVLLTTGQSELTEGDALAFGAVGLLHKPFKLKVIKKFYENLIQKRIDLQKMSA